MSKKIWLTDWLKPVFNVEEIVNEIDNSIDIQYVTLSDTKYAKRVYDVQCHKKKDMINVIDYFLEQERMIDGDDIEIVAMMLLKKDDEPFYVLNVAIDFTDVRKTDSVTTAKEGSATPKKYFVSNGALYDERTTKIKDFKEKLLS